MGAGSEPTDRIPPATLAAVVRGALGRPTARLGRWTATPLVHRVINRVTAGLWRVGGVADTDAGEVAWSLVVKEIHRPPDAAGSTFNASDDPGHWNYWRREALIATSGLLDDLPPGLAVPRPLLVEETGPTAARLWLEDVGGDPATGWPPARYGVAARHLGRLHGQFAGGHRPLPDLPWLSRDWLRAWVPTPSPAARARLHDPVAWQHPLLRDALPPDAAARVAALERAREPLLAAVGEAPRALCHLDCWSRNLFGRRGPDGAEQTVLIDWSQAGPGAIGEDIANLVLDSVWMRRVDAAVLPELERLALEGYAAGLAEGGWTGAPATVRAVHAIVGALRFGLLAGALLEMAHDESAYPDLARRYGEPPETTIRQRAVVVGHALRLADAALVGGDAGEATSNEQ